MADMQIVQYKADRGDDNERSKPNEEEFCRDVEQKFTPYVGQEFLEIEEAITFYKIYAIACGFDVRKYTTKRWHEGSIKSKLLVCNREGFTNKARTESHGCQDWIRNHKVRRVGCKARIRLFMKNGELLIDMFHGGHNHELISPRDREFQKLSCNLTDYHKRIILYNSRFLNYVLNPQLKIGATKTYKMLKEHVNGFENIGASLNDFKNFHRDIKCYIHQRDGQMFIDHFRELVINRPGFYFDYDVDTDGSLSSVIWADAISRRNYSIFGDGVSFDPTYTTNMYDMAFTPFTGVDHHKRSVTFCGALVAHEDAESFEWVFRRFLVAMGGKEPNFIITDQDPGILKAVPIVFKQARHRFCMWHIMNKVPSKYGVRRVDYIDFMKKMNTIIWDEDLEADDFDAKWEQIGKEHFLGDVEWFALMYAKRKQWVMAHCRDIDMGAVMRTTQRSESENSFFKRFECKSGTLVEFSLSYDSAMDQQRHTQKKLDNQNRHTSPKMTTHLALEVHASQVYTHKVFEEFQKEAQFSIDTCKSRGFTETDGVEVTTVKDAMRDRNYEVTFCPGTQKVCCTCRLPERKGIPCRHIIWICSSNGMKTVPDEYVVSRWCKDATRSKMFDCNGEAAEDIDIIDAKQIAMSVMWSQLHQTVSLLMGKSKADVESFTTLISNFKEKLSPLVSPLSKQQQLQQLLGVNNVHEVVILPPKKSKNKGSGKRMVSLKAKAVALANKPLRMCKNCKRLCHHDKRNCPNPFSKHPPLSPLSEELSDHDDGDDDDMEEEEGGSSE